jgi:hypothetical protein
VDRATFADWSDGATLLDDENAFAVADLGVNVRILAALLATEIEAHKGMLLLGALPHLKDQSTLRLDHPDGSVQSVEFDMLVIATGYATAEVCSGFGLTPPTIRLWRSHLVSMPRVGAASVFSVHPGEGAGINHGNWTVMGLNEDAELVGEPSFTPTEPAVTNIVRAAQRRFPIARKLDMQVTACVKVDVEETLNQDRSLNVKVVEIADGVVCALPGKMTETPVTANIVIDSVFARLGAPMVNRRPIDLRAELLHGGS